MTPDANAEDTALVTRHYETLLAEHYTWMSGGFADKVAEQTALLTRLGLLPLGSRRAVDLGCGPGFQAVALADLGYQVTAMDLSRTLLNELRQHIGGRPITILEGDLRSVAKAVAPGLSLAVCMGDTLPHLPTADDVWRLFDDLAQVLEPGGQMVLTYRDLSRPLTGPDRVIPVRADDARIMTCFLDYEDPLTVAVHDLIHIRGPEGWTLHKSWYRKLRLPVDQVCAHLTARGLVPRPVETIRGLSVIVADRV